MMKGYKIRTPGSFDTGGKKDPLKRVLTLIGTDDISQATQPKKVGFIGYQ